MGGNTSCGYWGKGAYFIELRKPACQQLPRQAMLPKASKMQQYDAISTTSSMLMLMLMSSFVDDHTQCHMSARYPQNCGATAPL